VIVIGEAHGTIGVRPADCALLATIRFPAVTALPAIIDRIRRIFDLGADPAIIGRHLAADPRLAPLGAARLGLRVPGVLGAGSSWRCGRSSASRSRSRLQPGWLANSRRPWRAAASR